jgi:ribosomal protein S18 acetylase RimI-like enzyme
LLDLKKIRVSNLIHCEEVAVQVEAKKTVVRPLSELDLEAITRIDEKVTGQYRPELWEDRTAYCLRRNPDSCRIAELDGEVVGFMMGDIRGGEFGLDETSGWVERFGIDPEFKGHGIGRLLFDSLVEHFRSEGATRLRTLVDKSTPEASGFLRAVGFSNSNLEALEMTLDA